MGFLFWCENSGEEGDTYTIQLNLERNLFSFGNSLIPPLSANTVSIGHLPVLFLSLSALCVAGRCMWMKFGAMDEGALKTPILNVVFTGHFVRGGETIVWVLNLVRNRV
jgi:hypothetical protein